MRAAGPVLILDDEPNLVATMAIILEAHGFEVATCTGVDDALALIAARPFSLLLADLSMPGDGSTAIAAMRRLQPQAGVVVLTGHIGPDDIPPQTRALADLILFKPVEIPVLVAALRQLLPA